MGKQNGAIGIIYYIIKCGVSTPKLHLYCDIDTQTMHLCHFIPKVYCFLSVDRGNDNWLIKYEGSELVNTSADLGDPTEVRR